MNDGAGSVTVSVMLRKGEEQQHFLHNLLNKLLYKKNLAIINEGVINAELYIATVYKLNMYIKAGIDQYNVSNTIITLHLVIR